VTGRDRVRLLFGPSEAPALRRGDLAFCLLRGCDVIITGRSNGRIPWPRCRAVDGPGGGSGLLLAQAPARAAGACPGGTWRGTMRPVGTAG
jgi:hypothetical protein